MHAACKKSEINKKKHPATKLHTPPSETTLLVLWKNENAFGVYFGLLVMLKFLLKFNIGSHDWQTHIVKHVSETFSIGLVLQVVKAFCIGTFLSCVLNKKMHA